MIGPSDHPLRLCFAALALALPTGPLPARAADIAVDDFTGNGRPDVLALLSLEEEEHSPTALLSQFGDLEFAGTSLDLTPLASQSEERMVLADLEGQGIPGILWVDRTTGTILRRPENPAVFPPWAEPRELNAGPARGAAVVK